MASKGVNRSENLIRRTRKLIDGYPKNSILKEFLQNADDARATELIVIYDARIHTSLKNTNFSPAKGPALLICNNSKFKKKDFDAIVEIGSEDSKQNDPNTTGRFGEGFNSSFSISDHPSFISNGRAYWFDILREAVSKDINSPDTSYWEEEDFNEIKDWLDVFAIDSKFYFNNYDTVFRLPLRNSKTKSKISNEIFSIEDFLEWVDEWKINASQLLFLRHVQKLVLQEIDINGKVTVHLKVDTKNDTEISRINNAIQKEFNGNSLDICKKWKDSVDDLPYFKYEHHFLIEYFEREKKYNKKYTEIWAVVNGLFRGENNSLVNQAIKALEIRPEPRKVMPWAGVAIQLDNEGNPQKIQNSKFFTILPLPIKSNYPVHIHGWFEINSERTQITCIESGKDLETLTKWNKLLLQEGVGRAWAILIESLKKESNIHYLFWAKSTEFDLDKNIINGFYKYIATLHCFFIQFKNKSEWVSPNKTQLYYINSKNDILLNALKEHFPIIKIKPPKYIIDNFKEIDIELVELTSAYIREYLEKKSKDLEFPVALEEVSISMLRKKEWLIEIIKYCADNGEDYSLIEKLPLELTLNGNIYKVGANTLFDKNPNLSLFQGNKHLFVDTDIVKSIGEGIDTLPTSWVMPTLKNKIVLLNSYIEEKDMTKEWIIEVVDLITSSKEDEFIEAKEEIIQLRIVYQEDENFNTLNSSIEDFSPFFPRGEDRKNNLQFYSGIQMNLVHYDYIDIYKKLLKFEGLITQLTPKSMIDHLLVLGEHDFLLVNDIREFVVQIISENISWFNDLGESQKAVLNTIPFIKTAQGNIYSKDTSITLFLPTNFEPLEHIESLKGEYELVAVKAGTALYNLYQQMGIDEQNINNYMHNIILPFLKNSDDPFSRKQVLKGLSEKWRDIKHELNDEIKHDLKNSEIIPTNQDESVLLSIGEIYIPDVDLPNILDDNPYKPIAFNDQEVQNDWTDLLHELGAKEHVMSKHILYKVEIIVGKDDKDDAIKLANYIANNFEVFEPMLYQGRHILEVLKDYAWLPVEYPKDIFKPKATYKKLQKPSELILRDDVKLVGGYYFVLNGAVKLGKKDESVEYSVREMAKLLGIVVSLPIEAVFESFRELMKLNPHNGQVLNYAKTFYKYIGRISPDRIDFDSDETTILINGQWIAPKYVYQLKINLGYVRLKGWHTIPRFDIMPNSCSAVRSFSLSNSRLHPK